MKQGKRKYAYKNKNPLQDNAPGPKPGIATVKDSYLINNITYWINLVNEIASNPAKGHRLISFSRIFLFVRFSFSEDCATIKNKQKFVIKRGDYNENQFTG